jgi:nucleotide-binding universal stress UspA family protein
MNSIKTILHPTDFSERSAIAFHLACSLARTYHARLLVLHVHPPGETLIESFCWSDLRQYQDPDSKIEVEHVLKEGDPAAVIVQLARETECDVIVMGTHGRTGLARLLTGSVAAKVVHHAPCAVVAIKTPLAECEPPAGSLL